MKKIIFFSILILSKFALADDIVAPLEQRDPAAVHIVDQAKLRQYPGGRDEQDIKIQPSLAQPTKNIDGSPVGEMAVPDNDD